MKDFVSRLRRPKFILLHDLVMVPIAWLGAYWLRFNLDAIPAPYFDRALESLPVVILLQAISFSVFGMYRGVWRFASIPDLLRILKAVIVGALAILGALFAIYRLDDIPRSVLILYGLLLVLAVSGPRFIYRWLKDYQLAFGDSKRVLIVGAGSAGEALARDLLRTTSFGYQPVAFVDDSPRRQGQDLHGIPVKGKIDSIPQWTQNLDIDLILIAIPSARSSEMRRIVNICSSTDVTFRTLPTTQALVSGRVSVSAIRPVSIEDLLGRDPVALDWSEIRSAIGARAVLITGAGGSIGSELCRQVAKLKPERLILLENSEFNLYSIEMELRNTHPGVQLISRLGDVCDPVTVGFVFEQYKPQIVFHAAAYKHVPLLEPHPREAVRNNVLGTQTLADAANTFCAEQFVLISTDKAVNPANTMGASKRIAEMYCQALNTESNTRYSTVRFGNVLGSAGSVVPLFQRQIAGGGPVTVTHPEIERFFMTITEATQLILQAAAIGTGGDIFVLDMGAPVKIGYLAEQMIRLSGKEPDTDIQIAFTGLRPGEKLYEELFYESESLRPTGRSKILLAEHQTADLVRLRNSLNQMKSAVDHYNEAELMTQIRQLVPEHQFSEAATGPGNGQGVPTAGSNLIAFPSSQ